jgi:hypothetical protein
MQCLSLLEKDVVATGLLKKMKNVTFGTNLFILKEILPILAKLSKTLQAGTINFSCLEPSIQERLRADAPRSGQALLTGRDSIIAAMCAYSEKMYLLSNGFFKLVSL